MPSDNVCHVHREYSWHPQILEARCAGRCRPGVRRVWAGAGPQHVSYRGEGISWQPPAYSLLVDVEAVCCGVTVCCCACHC